MTVQQSPYILPTLNSRLNELLFFIDHSLHDYEYERAWNDMRILYYAAPDNVQEKVKKEFEQIEQDIVKLTGYQGVDPSHGRLVIKGRTNVYLHKHCYEFYNKINRALYDAGLLLKKGEPTATGNELRLGN
jgi:hypothetical protein